MIKYKTNLERIVDTHHRSVAFNRIDSEMLGKMLEAIKESEKNQKPDEDDTGYIVRRAHPSPEKEYTPNKLRENYDAYKVENPTFTIDTECIYDGKDNAGKPIKYVRLMAYDIADLDRNSGNLAHGYLFIIEKSVVLGKNKRQNNDKLRNGKAELTALYKESLSSGLKAQYQEKTKPDPARVRNYTEKHVRALMDCELTRGIIECKMHKRSIEDVKKSYILNDDKKTREKTLRTLNSTFNRYGYVANTASIKTPNVDISDDEVIGLDDVGICCRINTIFMKENQNGENVLKAQIIAYSPTHLAENPWFAYIPNRILIKTIELSGQQNYDNKRIREVKQSLLKQYSKILRSGEECEYNFSRYPTNPNDLDLFSVVEWHVDKLLQNPDIRQMITKEIVNDEIENAKADAIANVSDTNFVKQYRRYLIEFIQNPNYFLNRLIYGNEEQPENNETSNIILKYVRSIKTKNTSESNASETDVLDKHIKDSEDVFLGLVKTLILALLRIIEGTPYTILSYCCIFVLFTFSPIIKGGKFLYQAGANLLKSLWSRFF